MKLGKWQNGQNKATLLVFFLINMRNELDKVAWVWNESVLKNKEIVKIPIYCILSTVFLFFVFVFNFFSLGSILCAEDRFLYFSFPHGGGAGLVTQLLSPYPPRQRSPTTSAMRSPAEIGVLSVKFELSHEKDRYFCKLWKTTQERKKGLMLPERELFLCQDASRSHLLSTSKTLLLPQLLCRTTKQRYATTCLGKIKWLSVRRGIRSPMELQYSDFPKLSDYNASSATKCFPIS